MVSHFIRKLSAYELTGHLFSCVYFLPTIPIFILVIRGIEDNFEFSIYSEICAVISGALVSYIGLRCNE